MVDINILESKVMDLNVAQAKELQVWLGEMFGEVGVSKTPKSSDIRYKFIREVPEYHLLNIVDLPIFKELEVQSLLETRHTWLEIRQGNKTIYVAKQPVTVNINLGTLVPSGAILGDKIHFLFGIKVKLRLLHGGSFMEPEATLMDSCDSLNSEWDQVMHALLVADGNFKGYTKEELGIGKDFKDNPEWAISDPENKKPMVRNELYETQLEYIIHSLTKAAWRPVIEIVE